MKTASTSKASSAPKRRVLAGSNSNTKRSTKPANTQIIPAEFVRQTENTEIAKMEMQLAKLVQKIYNTESGYRRIRPIHPWVLVRVLPKEMQTPGGIWLADKECNKPVYEGVVLETWAPYDEVRPQTCNGCAGEGEIIIHHECRVKIGQRILFPHFEGYATPYLDDKHYRMVREGTDQNKNPYCGVYGILDYQGDREVAKKITELMKTFDTITMSGSGGYKP